MPKKSTILIFLCAAVIIISAVLIRADMGFTFPAAAIAVTIVILFNTILRGVGSLITDKFTVQKWALKLCSALLTVCTVFLLICGLIYAVQDNMIFFHVSDPVSREILQGRPGYIEIEFTAENGKTYHGVMRQAYDGKAPLVIYFGGNGEVSHRHMRFRGDMGQWSYFAGFNYLFIDYEGYGLNEGRTSYRNMFEGALAVYDFAVTLPNVDSDRVVAMGFSLGTGSAVYLAANRPVAGLILAAPFANGHDLFNNVLPIFRGPLRLLVRQNLPSDRYAPYVTSPVLIIASRGDEIIPFSSSERLSRLFPGDVDFMGLDRARHNDIFQAGGVFNRIRSFLEGVK